MCFAVSAYEWAEPDDIRRDLATGRLGADKVPDIVVRKIIEHCRYVYGSGPDPIAEAQIGLTGDLFFAIRDSAATAAPQSNKFGILLLHFGELGATNKSGDWLEFERFRKAAETNKKPKPSWRDLETEELRLCARVACTYPTSVDLETQKVSICCDQDSGPEKGFEYSVFCEGEDGAETKNLVCKKVSPDNAPYSLFWIGPFDGPGSHALRLNFKVDGSTHFAKYYDGPSFLKLGPKLVIETIEKRDLPRREDGELNTEDEAVRMFQAFRSTINDKCPGVKLTKQYEIDFYAHEDERLPTVSGICGTAKSVGLLSADKCRVDPSGLERYTNWLSVHEPDWFRVQGMPWTFKDERRGETQDVRATRGVFYVSGAAYPRFVAAAPNKY